MSTAVTFHPASTNGKNGTHKASRSKTTEIVHYVIDLSALLKNPRCLFQYKDGDVYIPEHVIIGLEKKSSSRDASASFAAEAIDLIRRIIMNSGSDVADGFPLTGSSNGVATGKLHMRDTRKIDHVNTNSRDIDRILSFIRNLQESVSKSKVVLVTLDIKTLLAARLNKIRVEDDSDQKRRITESHLVGAGYHILPFTFFDDVEVLEPTEKQKKEKRFSIRGEACRKFKPMEFLYSKSNRIAKVTYVESVNGDTATLRLGADFSREEMDIFGLKPKNIGQNIAFNILTNHRFTLAIVRGIVGTGKSIVALGAALQAVQQSIEAEETPIRIVYTRALVNATMISEKKGNIPGGPDEKLSPWMRGMTDNVRKLLNKHPLSTKVGKDWVVMPTETAMRKYVEIVDINEIKGASFEDTIFIMDEAQNSDCDLIELVLTRTGERGKVILVGNIDQIDKKLKITVDTSGLTIADKVLRHAPYCGCVVLTEIVRCEFVANVAKALQEYKQN